MKTITLKKTTLLSIAYYILLIPTLSSCLKDDDIKTPDNIALLEIIHSSPNLPAVDFSFDNKRMDLNSFKYLDKHEYVQAIAGNRNFSIYKDGTNEKLYNKSITLQAKNYYSLFIADTASKLDAVLIKDSTRAAGADSVRIRFANMSPDAGSMDFYARGNNTALATNISYKSASQFISFKTANDVVFEGWATGGSTVLISSDKIDFSNKEVYTIWVTGFKGVASGAQMLVVDSFKH